MPKDRRAASNLLTQPLFLPCIILSSFLFLLSTHGSHAVAAPSLPADSPDSSSFFQAEYQRYDGWYNNLAHADWGSLGTFTPVSHFLSLMNLCAVRGRFPKASREEG